METPKEKARRLVARYACSVMNTDERVVMDDGTIIALPSKMPLAKQCALQTVDEVMEAVVEATGDELGGPQAVYWGMVRREIEEL